MKEHVQLHRFYTSLHMQSLRAVLLILLTSLTVLTLLRGEIPNLALFFLSLLIMWEVFFHFSLSHYPPKLTLEKNDGTDPVASFTHVALDTFYAGNTTTQWLPLLFRQKQARFLLERLLIDPAEVQIQPVTAETVSQKAYEVAKSRKATYITTMDLLVAYLLITEEQSQLLFTKELKPLDLQSALSWSHMAYPGEERPRQLRFNTIGDGIGDVLVSGWTPETEKYTRDYTSAALAKNTGMIGRETEYQALLSGLMKNESSNVLLVGDAGVGKEKLVATLARDSFEGKLDRTLNHKRIITLMVGPFMAGAENRAELESRLQTIIAELSHAGNIILFIPEMQEVLGESSFNLNLSGALLPYLQDGNIPIIASITKGNYKAFMEKSGLLEVFSVITLTEPEPALTRLMLFNKVIEIEKQSHLILPYKTVLQAQELSRNYLPDDVLPGSAIRLLTDAAGHASNERLFMRKPVILPEIVISVVEGKVHASVAAPKKEEKALLLHLEDKLHERVIGQEHAIQVISEALRRLRSGVTKHERPVSFLFLGPTGVGKTETAKALAALYFGGEEKMLRLDMSEYSDADSVQRLLGSSPGEGDERGELTDKIHDNPYTLVLLDEFEKANPKILDLFLQVLADGRLTDNKGRTVSFTNSLIIATSNAASEFIREEVKKGTKVDTSFQSKLLETIQTTHLFKPELLNRFDGVVVFTPLTETDLQQVTKQLLSEVTKQLGEQDITITFDENIIQKIIKEGSDEQFGARPLNRYIQDTVEKLLATMKLEEKLKRGDKLHFTVNETGEIGATITN